MWIDTDQELDVDVDRSKEKVDMQIRNGLRPTIRKTAGLTELP